MKGFRECRDCGEVFDCAVLVGGLCPECARMRAYYMVALQGGYEAALAAGDAKASRRIADLIGDYKQAEQIRLREAQEEKQGVKYLPFF